MRVKTMIIALLATVLIANFTCPANAQGQTPEAAARAKMVGKKAPALNVGQWVNTAGKSLSLAGLKGKVVVLDFFTFW